MSKRHAFTYIELSVVIVITGILVVAALPDGDTAANQQGLVLIHRFEADVAYARSMSIAQPANPVIINVDGMNNRYWLARASAPTVPILHPQTKQPYLIQSGSAGTKDLEFVRIVGLDFNGGQILSFDSTGSTGQNSNAILQVQSGSSSYQTSVSSGSGNTISQSGFSQTINSSSTGFVF